MLTAARVLVACVAATITPAVVPVGSAPAPAPPRGAVPAVVRYRAPLAGRVVVLRPFDPPATRYGAGHLGVDLAAVSGSPVLAAAAGVVTFAGRVAGRGVVVLRHPDGIRTEYEPVVPAVHPGSALGAGAMLGSLSGRHRGCAAACLHWGARRGERYLDPLSLLQPLGRVRLVPVR